MKGDYMQRLTERVFGFIQLKACGNDFCKETCEERDEEKSCKNCPIQKAFEKLATYEDLEEQGLLLRLPCKIGTTVYNTTWWDDVQEKVKVDGKTFCRTVHKHKVSKSTFSLVDIYDFGKTVFLTQAEAEQKLKEIDGSHDGE